MNSCHIPEADYWVVIFWFLGAYLVFMHSQTSVKATREWILQQLQFVPLNNPERFADMLLVTAQVVVMVLWPMFAAISLGARTARMLHKDEPR